jgi:hypothetical protein
MNLVIFRDLNTAMMYKGQHSDYTMLVSLENAEHSFDALSEFIPSSMKVILLRLIQPLDSPPTADIHQFDSVFHISQIPSLIIFGPNQTNITHSWIGSWPSETELVLRISPPKPTRPVKIALHAISRSTVHEFPPSATVGDLRDWIFGEFGEIDVIIGFTQKSLPVDRSLTLESAGLSPNAVLREIGHSSLAEDRNLSPVRREREHSRYSGIVKKVVQVAKVAVSVLNPWDDGDDSEDFWEFWPNPEIAENVRNVLHM